MENKIAHAGDLVENMALFSVRLSKHAPKTDSKITETDGSEFDDTYWPLLS